MNFITVYGNEYMRISVHAYNDRYEVNLKDKNAKILIGTPRRNAIVEIIDLKPSVISIGKLTAISNNCIVVHSYNLQDVNNYENPLRLIDNNTKCYYLKVEFNPGTNGIITGRFNRIPEDKMSQLLPITIARYAREILYYLDYIVGDAKMTPLQPWRTEQILIYMCKYLLKKTVRGDIDEFARHYDALTDLVEIHSKT